MIVKPFNGGQQTQDTTKPKMTSKVPQENSYGKFSLQYFSDELRDFSIDKYTKEIQDNDTAIMLAREVWIDIYGKDCIENIASYVCLYDSENKAWFISANIDNPVYDFGGSPYVIIREDGKVLAVWHTR